MQNSNYKFPTFFISHGGGPCFWMDWNPPDMFDNLAESFKTLHKRYEQKPKAILVISAHWEEEEFTIQSHPNPPMLYDYYGFPENTYELKYPAQTSTDLIQQTKKLMQENGIICKEDSSRGYDHGLFVPFLLIYPKADIPIVQISMKKNLNPEEHFKLGLALEPLRKSGFLIVGSGLSYHNLRNLKDVGGHSEIFDKHLTETVLEKNILTRHQKLISWDKMPSSRNAHPREDHLVPLFVVTGAAGNDFAKIIYTEKMKNWTFRSSSYQFG